MDPTCKPVAFVVFRGKTPGVYYSEEECQQQIEGVPKSKVQAFTRAYDAELAWSEWQRKLFVKLGASTFLQQTAPKARPRLEAAYAPPPRTYSTHANEPIPRAPAERYERHEGRMIKGEPLEKMLPQNSRNMPCIQALPGPVLKYETKNEFSSPLHKHEPSSLEQSCSYSTPPPSSSPMPSFKRPANYIEISDDEADMKYKKPRVDDPHGDPVLTAEERFELRRINQVKAPRQTDSAESAEQ
ncbi:hypothetical protein ONS95_006828 [Cadophora gregata]|uniref:uncharacterized protein n=1 Tax=Cadophora gregata TaxID=51156 RepID=UPI0026DCBDA3|nr:uncharacterized protein ONS95_006828 [Cadophora gregata]KAK0101670.1 hypothetical protein ONS95_006828 [Cadophora gregata]KAK0106313.1 hypothetical protein ONS96_003951 [Cadophora gregata f. sp. sojae]